MRVVVLLYFLVLFIYTSSGLWNALDHLTINQNREYNSLSRGELLRVLSDLEQKTTQELYEYNLKIKPIFTAKYANNELTRDFIYPLVSKKTSGMIKDLPPNPKFFNKTSLIQLGYGVWVNLGLILYGTSFSFSAIAVPQFAFDENINPTREEIAWFTSIFSLTSVLGCLLCGIMIDKFGRKIVLIFHLLPYIAGWLYTGFSRNITDLIWSRALTGIGCGMTIPPVRIYCAEMSMPSMRGVIGTLVLTFSSIGIAIQAVMGAQLHWSYISFCNAAYALVLMITYAYLPESPFYLLLKYDDSSMSAKSLKKFRAADYDISIEIEDMEEFKSFNNLIKLKCKNIFVALFSASACKPLTVVMIYVLIFQLGGVSVVWLWTIEMLHDSKSSVEPNIGNIIIAVIRCASAIISGVLIYTAGRRPLAISSALIMSFAAFCLGLHAMVSEKATVIPIICMSIYVICSILGYYTLPILMMSEIYPVQIRGILCGMTVAFSNVIIFGVNRWYPSFRDKLGYPSLVMAFAGFCFLGTIYLYFVLPETKDLTLAEIEEFYNQHRATLVSSRAIISSQLALYSDNRRPRSLNNENLKYTI